MGFFDKFKKKDDFAQVKDPMSDPLGQLPGDSLSQSPKDSLALTSPTQDLPPSELPGINDAPGSNFGSAIDKNNSSTSAASIPSLPKMEDSFGAQRQSQPQMSSPMSTGIDNQQTSPQPSPVETASNKDFELINSKLDNIKSLLENLNQRVAHLEQEKHESEGPRPRRLNW